MTQPSGATALVPPPPGLIHIWRIDLQHAALLERGVRLLSPDEAQRARRLRFEQHRHRFMAGRSAMRLLLGGYTGRDPAALRFRYGPHGKPALPAGDAAPDIRFNFSNSGRHALLAVAVDRELGIDLENRRREINLPGLVRHILNDAEAGLFERLPEAVRHRAMLTIWTRKEAWIKALGAGFSRPLKSFSVPIDPQVTVQVMAMPEQPGTTRDWTFRLLDSHPDDIATLVAPGTDWTCRCFDWPPADSG
jgi:4'-phosphopantetheinyl transferase